MGIGKERLQGRDAIREGGLGSNSTFPLEGKPVASGPRTREMVKAWRLFGHLAVQGMSHSAEGMAPFLAGC